ncbi:hypothetical protein [Nocardia amikacinitolerans]|uniref:hypothetical protein n=1 Tax=Nocardia amikacinitolerans TaxID=756689 RepID=UPI0020A5FDAA|nr:hypothetical protein [Nocardia amikacinitolerans]
MAIGRWNAFDSASVENFFKIFSDGLPHRIWAYPHRTQTASAAHPNRTQTTPVLGYLLFEAEVRDIRCTGVVRSSGGSSWFAIWTRMCFGCGLGVARVCFGGGVGSFWI